MPDTTNTFLSASALVGVVTHVVTLWFRERANEQKRDHENATHDQQRNDECEERWRSSQVEIRQIATDLASLQVAHGQCPRRIAALESLVRDLMYRTPDAREWARLNAQFPEDESTPVEVRP